VVAHFPDLTAGDSLPVPGERAFILSLGRRGGEVPRGHQRSGRRFRATRRGEGHGIVVVTPAMREQLVALAVAARHRGVAPGIRRGDLAGGRQRGNEIARQAFGLPVAGRRFVRNDKVVQRRRACCARRRIARAVGAAAAARYLGAVIPASGSGTPSGILESLLRCHRRPEQIARPSAAASHRAAPSSTRSSPPPRVVLHVVGLDAFIDILVRVVVREPSPPDLE